jgi:hypothetical protein
VPGDLGRALLDPERRAEIDGELEGRLARAGQRLGGDDGADADVDLEEIIEGDARRRRLGRIGHAKPLAHDWWRQT